jgi:hypothetical protein
VITPQGLLYATRKGRSHTARRLKRLQAKYGKPAVRELWITAKEMRRDTHDSGLVNLYRKPRKFGLAALLQT